MKKILKNASLIALGLVIGFTATSMAKNQQINVVKDSTHKVFLDGIRKDTDLLNYQNNVYAPLRFFSEQMGMEVNYDGSYKVINVKNDKAKKLNDQIDELKKSQEDTEKKLRDATKKIEKLESDSLKKQDNSTKLPTASAQKLSSKNPQDARKESIDIAENAEFKTLPIYFNKDDLFLELTQAIRKDGNGNSNFYINIKNKTQQPVMIDSFSARFSYIMRGGGYKQIALDDVFVNEQDKLVLSSFPHDYDGRFYLTLDDIDDDIKEGVLSFNYYTVGNESEITRVNMAMKF